MNTKFQKLFELPIIILSFLIMILVHTGLAQSTYKYEVEKIVNEVYVLKPVINKYRWVTANIVVIVNEKDVLVVDSGLLPAAADEAIKEIRKLTDKPVAYLVNTHWHGDHWQGNESFIKEYPDVRIIATEQGLKGMSRNGIVWANQLYRKYFQNYIDTYEKSLKEKKVDGISLNSDELKELSEGIADMKHDLESIKNIKPALPAITFSDKLVIKSGSHEIQLLYMGIGNTSGDAIVYLPAEKVLIPGDLVVHPSPYESGMFSPEWLETSVKLDEIDFNYLVPGHGDVQFNHAYLRFLNALFREIIKQIGVAYESGNTRMDDISKIVTHESVTHELAKDTSLVKFTGMLDAGFVPACVQTSFKRVIQGKQ